MIRHRSLSLSRPVALTALLGMCSFMPGVVRPTGAAPGAPAAARAVAGGPGAAPAALAVALAALALAGPAAPQAAAARGGGGSRPGDLQDL